MTKRNPETFDMAPTDDQHIPRKLRDMLMPTHNRVHKKISNKKTYTETNFANKTNSLSSKKKEKRKAYFDKKKEKSTRKAVVEDDGYRQEIIPFGDIAHCPPTLVKFK